MSWEIFLRIMFTNICTEIFCHIFSSEIFRQHNVGVFLFLGRKLMTGNSFLKRITDAFAERRRLPDNNPLNLLGRKKTLIYTGVQVLCLLGLFGFKQMSSITIFFPAMIGVLMSIRAFALPKIFSEDDFVALGDPTPV